MEFGANFHVIKELMLEALKGEGFLLAPHWYLRGRYAHGVKFDVPLLQGKHGGVPQLVYL